MKTLEPAAHAAAALEALLEALGEPAVRDLAWLLFSPDLLREQAPAGKLACCFESPDEGAATHAWLLELDRDAEDLRRFVAASGATRLGRYAECLLAYFLRCGPTARLVAANVALRRAGRTLGECDFLVETASGRRLHWELAVKCYLHVGGARSSLADYVGPNLQDRFDHKLAHLLGHQLPLSARDEFASLGHAGPWDAQMFVKGWLFYPSAGADADASTEVPAIPPEIDPAHARGFWIARADWLRSAASSGAAWTVLPRLSWLAPRRSVSVDSPAAQDLGSAAQLSERLAQPSGPMMIAAFAQDGRGQWRERSRGFVVPDDWPERAMAFAGQ